MKNTLIITLFFLIAYTIIVKYKSFKKSNTIELLEDSIQRIREPLYDTLFVSMSTYQNTVKQCNNRPNETASGYTITKNDTTTIAVSRDLLFNTDLHFGDTVLIRYKIKDSIIVKHKVVRDIMNYKFENSIDILSKENFKVSGELIFKK